jgi:uncharacterized CHY-type Zn-finger protein
MQPFTCPQCGHESTFDPWTEAAHCPQCGFTPPTGKERHGYIRWANRYTYQQFLDELLSHWSGSHTPDTAFILKTPDDAERFFREYQQALGEAPQGEPGRQATYVRGYQPNRQEVLIFAGGVLHLRRGDYSNAAEDLRVLTLTSPDFVEPWIWLTATVDDPAERQKCLERATELDAAHPLARDALAMAQDQVPLDVEQREQEVTTTQCPQCGGALRYEPDAAVVTCPYCNHSLALEGTNLVDGEASSVHTLRLQRRYQGHTWAEVDRIVHCQNCGAELTMTEHLAQHCAFCGSTNVLVEDNERTLQQPDGFLPFGISSRQAVDTIRRERRSGLRRITALWSGDELVIEELQGIYLPFWVFDGMVETSLWSESFVTPTKGSSQVHMIENLLLPGVDVPSASLLAKDVLRFNLHSLVPYEPRLLADWPARLYTLDVERVVEDVYEDLLARARRKAPNPAATGDAHVSAQVLGATYQLVLLPVWMALVQGQDGRQLAVVNGQTGRVGFGSVLPADGQRNGAQG